jgi:hypothetical protein
MGYGRARPYNPRVVILNQKGDFDMNAMVKECCSCCCETRSMCLATMQACLNKGGKMADAKLCMMLVECAQLCQTCADCCCSNSDRCAAVAAACAKLCEECARSCDSMCEPQLAKCSEMLRACAKACRCLCDDDKVVR